MPDAGTMTVHAIIVAPGEGRFIELGTAGAGVTVKAADAETGGLCSVWEGHVPPGMVGAGPHVHRARDEWFYVLEGQLVFQIGDERHDARAGTFAFVPRGTVHGFRNASGDRAKLLVVHHPAGFERYFDAMLELAARGGTSEERAALGARFDVFSTPDPMRP